MDDVEDKDSRSSATGLSTVTIRFVGDFFHIPNLELISRWSAVSVVSSTGFWVVAVVVVVNDPIDELLLGMEMAM